ncbi:NAD(P)-binding protein [Pseudovirgaria hyperparasitica]|uniref:Probable quinone oxidoreductase n=1 Tax=Pseudovirgaria hyperparasitica TaxID=470096 RepID=A0A6A6VRM4_9PEZI|nr:NAD(P)-binding protein [Pseudovirgaria hyperparasitica]KAF2752559.1 NAD(P)-binding protein [Pseudovirgaria hyperparasitica]
MCLATTLAIPKFKALPVLCPKTVLQTPSSNLTLRSYFRTGLYKPPSFPHVLGREASGTIVSTGSGNLHSLKIGDRVIYIGTGAYAEYTIATSLHTSVIPPGISQEVAAASLLQGVTALTLIRESHPVKKGDWVLVHAAAGGVGLWLCQLLKAVGAHAIGTASTPEKRELARSHGAEVLIDYTKDSVPEKVKEVTNGAGVIAVFDGVGKSTFDDSLESIARKGTLVSFGNASGAPDPLVLARLAAKNAKVQRPTLFNYIVTRQEYDGYVQELFKYIQDNNLDPRVHDTYPLAEVARAHQDLEGRKTTGKLILKP